MVCNNGIAYSGALLEGDMRCLLGLLWALAIILLSPDARADKRVALVIGNAAYQNTTPLLNPSNDAGDVAGSLTRLGFDVVDGRDLDKRSMERLIRQFAVKLSGADVALFFYAGHGLQVEGRNFLVPTDAKLTSEGDVDFESLSVDLVVKQMERDAKTSLVLLDACRDNPLARSLARSMGTRSTQVGQGLAEVKAGIGTLIGFSTQPGAFALDGTGRNSPYTEALLKHLETPGKDFSGVLVEVRNDVLKTTGGRQVPWEHTSLTGQVYLRGLPAPGAADATPIAGLPPPPKVAPAPVGHDRDLEIIFWNSVKDSKSPAVLETYLERYPNGTFSTLARILIANLKDAGGKTREPAKAAAAPAPEAKAPPKAAEPLKTAAISVPDVKPQPAADPQVLARALQTELKRVGCDPGPIDGKWGSQAKEALGDFARHAKMAMPTDEPTGAALEAVAARNTRICPVECDKGEKEVNGKCVAEAKPTRKVRSARERDDPPARSRSSSERSSEPSPGGGLIIGIGRGRGGIGIGF
jgi:hypothetical protein